MTPSSTAPNKGGTSLSKTRIAHFFRRHGGTLLALAAIALFLAAWEIVAVCVHKEYMLPRFSAVIVAFGKLWATKDFYVHTGATLLRCFIGFAIAFAAGAVVGVLGGVFPLVRSFFKPSVAFFRAAPTMGLTLIVLVWLRAAYTPVCIGFLMVFPIIYTTIADAVATAPRALLEMADVYRMPKGARIRHIYLPHALPMIFSACSTAFALNIKATVSAEILAHTLGSVGVHMTIAASDLLDGSALLFAWLLVAVLLSVAVEALLKLCERLVKWRYHYAT